MSASADDGEARIAQLEAWLRGEPAGSYPAKSLHDAVRGLIAQVRALRAERETAPRFQFFRPPARPVRPHEEERTTEKPDVPAARASQPDTEFEGLLDAYAAAKFACGKWRLGDVEPFHALHVRAAAARAALRAYVARLTADKDVRIEQLQAQADEFVLSASRQQMEIDRLAAAEAERDAARGTVAFFTSVIKCGESWTPACEDAYRRAMSRAVARIVADTL